MDMNRREALLRLATLLGVTTLNPQVLTAGVTHPTSHAPVFGSADLALLDEIAETIIPATDVPGAKAAQVGAFITMMLTNCYDAPVQAAVSAGVDQLAAAYRSRFNEAFVGGSAANRTTFLNELDAEQKRHASTKRADQPHHYFRVLKELTVLGYFSSEIGATQALRYIEVPGRFSGAEPYKKGDRAFYN